MRSFATDGEAIVLRSDGFSDFAALRSRTGARSAVMIALPSAFIIPAAVDWFTRYWILAASVRCNGTPFEVVQGVYAWRTLAERQTT